MERLLLLPNPLPDESLYSLVVRYHRMVANVSYRRTSHELFGTYSRTCGSVLPCCLGSLSARTEGLYSFPDLVESLTLLPLYKPFLPAAAYEFAVRRMEGTDGTGLKMRLGMTASGLLKYASFRYCEACVEHDTSIHGIPYWHRIHQATGVCSCPIHGGTLVAASLPRHSEWTCLLLPGEAGGTPLFPLAPGDAAAVVAEMQFWGLANPEAVSGLLLGGFLRERLAEIGLLQGSRLKETAIKKFVDHRIGESFAHYEFQPVTKSCEWVMSLLRQRLKIIHPFHYFFLCWLLEANLEELRNFDPQKSPKATLKRISSCSKHDVLLSNELDHVRRKFTEDSNVRCHDKAGYYWLYRHDRAWLREYVTSRSFCKQASPRVDWCARDEILSREIVCAYAALKGIIGKPIRVTKAELLRRVSNDFGVGRNPSKLPSSAKLIEEFSESEHDFQLRKLVWAINELSPLQNCALSMLMRMCGIRVLKVADSEVEDLVKSRYDAALM